MLTVEEKNKMVDLQIREYEVKIFQLEMNKMALLTNGDEEGANGIDNRIEAIRKAITAVSGMKE